MKLFKEEEKSTFHYWFAHWCAYQMVALDLHVWKFKYLFHDAEKPWLKLILPYEKVRKIHRTNNRHHLWYKGGADKLDFEAMVIDWECSRFTKEDAPMNARETYEYMVTKRYESGKISKEIKEALEKNIPSILDKLGL